MSLIFQKLDNLRFYSSDLTIGFCYHIHNDKDLLSHMNNASNVFIQVYKNSCYLNNISNKLILCGSNSNGDRNILIFTSWRFFIYLSKNHDYLNNLLDHSKHTYYIFPNFVYSTPIDWIWNSKLFLLLKNKIITDEAMSWLSTLGGGFSSLGDKYFDAANIAGQISQKQMSIAIKMNHSDIQTKCKIWYSISLMQKGNLINAARIIRRIHKSERDPKIKAMCQGVWARLQYLWKVGNPITQKMIFMNKKCILKYMNIVEISFLEDLLLHIKSVFKTSVSITNNKLVTDNEDAKNFFGFFVKNNIELRMKLCQSLQNLFSFCDIKFYFQAKNRVILSLKNNQLFVHGSKTYAEMAYNLLLKYISWDSNCKDNMLNENEIEKLSLLSKRENIILDQSLSVRSKKLLLNILENSDEIEIVNVSKESCNWNQYCNNIIDLSMDDDEDVQIISERRVILTPQKRIKSKSTLRPVIIDGSNVAFSHGCGNFNPRGINIAVNYFIQRGHKHVYALIPRHRQMEGGQIFEKLEKSNHLIYTPSRIINNKRETCYDDRLILEAAHGHNGVVVTNDQYRDLLYVHRFKDIIINRLIPYTFVGDLFMIPDDPKGQLGPNLRTILSVQVKSVNNIQNFRKHYCRPFSPKRIKYSQIVKRAKRKNRNLIRKI